MSFHLYRINEIYSDAGGTLQFVELTVGNSNGQNLWNGVTITTTRNGVTHSFTFTGNLPSATTANTAVLIATQGFAAVAKVTPNFVVPDGFLFPEGGTLNFGGVDMVSYGPLPTNGVNSIDRNGAVSAATPKNFAGATGALPSIASVVGTAGDDTLAGSTKNELIDGLAGNDTLRSGGGNDTLRAGAGDDVVYSGKGNDVVDGGDGYDYLYFTDATAGVVIDLPTGVASGGAGADRIAAFELIFGSAFDDTFVGNDASVGFLGLDGNDTLTGGAGRDHLEGNGGDDVIDGGDGVDNTAYYSAAFAVDVNLGTGIATGGLGRDTLRSIEDVVGSVFGDTLTGSTADNRLEGADGDDRFFSTAGNDVLDGGNGIDTATYVLARSAYTLRRADDGSFSVEKPDAAGSDSLLATERLQFADTRLALDLDGAAGQTAKLLGAVFGVASLSNKAYVGIGLSLVDGGTSYVDLATLAMNAAGVTLHADVVARLWSNLFGVAPTAEQAAPFVAMLDGGTTVGALTVLAADTSFNTDNIQLTGLVQSGIEFSL